MDHRRGPRRRGEVLLNAIVEATLAELAEVGYAGLTMDGVAQRARTSKASLYRRWPTRQDLVAAAIRHTAQATEPIPDTGELRADLLAALDLLAQRLTSPVGEAVRGILTDTLRDPELTRDLRETMVSGRNRLLTQVLRRAAERGEIPAEAITPQVVAAGPALVLHHFLLHGPPMPAELRGQIVDEVLLPLVRR
ncbi:MULTISPECIES: TetR/AcrR family transcriptional regulator [unclassified Crossiella]|uniref:TetR/AcrR family transcriptional regulator n=1 Tax=unclassified Crossiella TaxID=2620835 RepID=UPI001FFFC69D|nr:MULTISPECIES: TetR/AcrR family transcriptional regulator [unclassified Crossiella]MCK2239206.1 TetR/AcrR family transcriptional regulator [Crossiella sp. S99.2]MCK2251225.1 TetR/AcrR family transcriptional regulator [Crossiella sp. S99.1]